MILPASFRPWIKLFGSAPITLALFLAASAASATVRGGGEGFETQVFAAHPIPAYEELAQEEWNKINLLSEDHSDFCQGFVSGYYRVYTSRLLKASRIGDLPDRRAFRRAALQQLTGNGYSCFIGTLISELRNAAKEVSAAGDGIVCNFKLPEALAGDPVAHDAMADLVWLIRRDNRLALWAAAGERWRTGWIGFNPDITYYLRLRAAGTEPLFRRSDRDPDGSERLSNERREFVKAAAARGDLDAVIRTSPPC